MLCSFQAGLGPAPPLITAIQKYYFCFALDRTLASAISATTLAADFGSNRASRWFERETGRSIGEVQRFVCHPKLDWMGATLGGIVPDDGAVCMLPWNFAEDVAADKHMRNFNTTCW